VFCYWRYGIHWFPPLFGELIDAGHQVIGLARSEKNAKSLAVAGPRRIADRSKSRKPAQRRSGPARKWKCIHAAFHPRLQQLRAAAEADRRAIETLGGASRALIVR